MRKVLLTLIVGTFLMSSNGVSAQAMEEGNVGIDLYYGFPDLYRNFFQETVGVWYADEDNDLTVGGLGPIGLRAEYMLADKVGLGIDVGYSSANVKFSQDFSVYNATTMTNDIETYDYKLSTAKIGVMVVFNYHFIDNDALDFFGTFGTGYKNRSYKFTSTNPDDADLTDDEYFGDIFLNLLPVSFRMGLGMRYFFTDNIGINLGVGFGQGGIANGGVSFKF